MFLRMLQRANYLLTEYEIFDYPVPMDIIISIITDHRIKIVISNNVTGGSVFSNVMLIPGGSSNCVRENMVHEYCHVNNHCQNYYTNCTQIAKNEAQAKAFSAYFLMPVFVFENDLSQGCSDYELSESFGVHIDFVRYRKKLTEGLLNIDYFKKG